MSTAERAAVAPLALVDLGDTLAECTPALHAAISAAERRALEEQPGAMALRCRELLTAPGFWRTLAPRPAGMSLLELLRRAGYRPTVLTKGPSDAPVVWSDKVAWCRAHLPGVPVIVTDDKSPVSGEVLVDDWLPYVEAWQRRWPASLVIVPAQPWNQAMSVNPRRLRDDGGDRAAILAALRR